tara:strand:- start:33 stop:260 length:228 start_codon:yes stop_codon:yes gene_type:complete
MTKKIEKLRGKELTSYIEKHKQEFDGNGDKLCVAAGYGIQADDGKEKCDFSDFVKALSIEEIENAQSASESKIDL